MNWPEALPQFSHVNRTWDTTFCMVSAKIRSGQIYVTQNKESISTVLGSCISACIRDPHLGAGGMNHFLLPGEGGVRSNTDSDKVNRSARYGISAMESLINEILKLGARKSRLEVKLFGGAKILKSAASNVGQNNIDFVRNFFQVEKIPIAAEDLGGIHARRVVYFPNTGRVMVQHPRSINTNTLAYMETDFEQALCKKDSTGEIELFD